ncbi:amidohydrolase [Enterocloster lavalensis]|uniref:M20 metallopeptidase family protein n=1 Tax=Enterocloster lavalensis TaxID=460384 RepID=UPI002A80CB04|nr:amidohydrolase [Enterocloster lavalensis]
MTVKQLIEKNHDYILEMRREFHRHPELSCQEERTSRRICEELEKIGIFHTVVGNRNVVGIINPGAPGKRIAIRGDIDALPITEETGLPFASENPGVMHACGHDGHAAILLGIGKSLQEIAGQLNGSVFLCFQIAEEIGKGADEIVEYLKANGGVDEVISTHLMSWLPLGSVTIPDGPVASGFCLFNIKVQGVGGHGSRPHLAVNPLMPAAEILLKIAAIPANRHNTFDTCVVSPCAINGGNKSNIIPETATIIGSIRSFKYGDAQKIMGVMKEIAEHTARSYGATAEVTAPKGFAAPAINNDEVAARGRALAREMGLEVITPEYPNIGSDNYADFLEAFPGFYCFIGSMKDGENITNNHHHPKFDIDESSLDASAEFMAEYAVRFLK